VFVYFSAVIQNYYLGTIRKQSIQATLIMTIGVLLGFVLKLFIFTRYLSTEEIGLLTVILDAANLFAAFIPLGGQGIFIRFLPFFRDSKDSSPADLLRFGALLAIIGFALFLLVFQFIQADLMTFFSRRAPLLAEFFYLLVPLVFVRVIYIVSAAYSRALKKNIFPLWIKEVLVRLLTGMLVLAYAYERFDLQSMVMWYVGIYFIAGAVMSYYMIRLGYNSEKSNKKRWIPFRSREIVLFGLFAVLTSAGETIIRNIDSVMLASMRGLSATGIYGIAFFIGQIIEMPRRALSHISAPFVADAASRDDQETIRDLYQKSALNQFLSGVILLICVWTNLDSLFQIIPNGQDYDSGKYVVLFIAMGKLIDMSMGINGNIIQNSPHYRFNFYAMSLLAVLGVATNLLLIPLFGINGAALASLISLFLVNLARAVFIKVRLGLLPFSKSTMLAILIAATTYALAYFLPLIGSPLWDLIFRSGSSLLLFWGLVYYSGISPDINQLVKQALKSFRP
jgi:O-antigen/teichoic acid export membrane protein